MQIYGILLNIRGILLKNRENQRNSFLNTPILCSTAYLSVNYSHRVKISRFFFGGSNYSSYFCHRL